MLFVLLNVTNIAENKTYMSLKKKPYIKNMNTAWVMSYFSLIAQLAKK